MMPKVDCHVHTAYSGDARVSLDEIGSALEAGLLDWVCVTDHNSVRGGLELAERYPDRVVVGSEVKTWAGEIIGLFLNEHVPRRSDPAEVCEAIRAQGGLVYIPHPFCPAHHGLRRDVLDDLCARQLVDVIEAFNAKASIDSANEEAARYAASHGLAAGAGSDAHYPEFLGRAYVEIPPFEGSQGFLSALRDGNVHGTRYTWADARWRTKLVP
jgi:predicted metal-dependent phosphoesterase TrpH